MYDNVVKIIQHRDFYHAKNDILKDVTCLIFYSIEIYSVVLISEAVMKEVNVFCFSNLYSKFIIYIFFFDFRLAKLVLYFFKLLLMLTNNLIEV